MSDIINNLFRTDFMPHGVCYQWIPEILWLNVVADLLIATSYFSIPIAIYYFVKRRTDLEFKGIFLLFSLFIALCGLTHFISILVIWNGAYGFHGMLKLLTAIVSCITAYKVYSSIPAALQLPTADQIKKAAEESNKVHIETIQREHRDRQDLILRESTDSAHVGILVINGDGVISMANKTVCNIFGYAKAELENQHINLLLAPDFREKHALLMKRFIDSDEKTREMAMNRIVTGFNKAGHPVPLEIRLTRAGHDRQTIYVSLQDVSERLSHEKALAASESVTESILNHIPLGVRIYQLQDLVLRFIQQNPAASSLLQSFTDDPFLADTKLTDIMIEAITDHKDAIKADFPLPAIGRNTFQLYLFRTSPDRIAVMFEDITEQKQFEGNLIQQEDVIRRAVNASIAGVYIFDFKSHKNLFVNERFEAITGFTLNELNNLEDGFATLIHEDDRDKIENHLHYLVEQAEEGEVYTIQYRAKHANGQWLWLMSQDAPFERDKHGNITQLIGSFLDFTPLKRMQENLLSLKDKAESANQSKSEFLANMSHEIRTPMNAIIALTDMVLKLEMGHKQREYLKKVQTSSLSLLQILNDILDYSKLEAGKFEISNEPFDLYRMLSSTLHLFATTAHQKGIGLNSKISPQVPRFVSGDAIRITQIINNLIGNAIKFTEAGEVSLTVSSEKSTMSGAYLVSFAITDTGIGIEADNLKSLFSSFSQADSSIERRFGGTGLGLAISKHLASLQNGSINVDSTPGEGSCFTLTLPLVASHQIHSALIGKLEEMSVSWLGKENATSTMVSDYLHSLGAKFSLQSNVHSIETDEAVRDIAIIDTTILNEKDKTRLVEILLGHHLSHIREGIIFLSTENDYHEYGSEIILNTASSWLLEPFNQADLDDAVIALLDRRNTLRNRTSTPGRLQFKQARVLLVEDHPTNQFVAVELLTAVGIEVDIAKDGIDALRKFPQRHYDLVLMDLQMPNMDGFTAAQKIRALKVGKTTPIFAMSAAVMEADKERVLAVGMDGHIPKPVIRDQLYSLLEKVLSKKQLHADSTVPTAAETNVETEDDEQSAIRRALATTLIHFDTDSAIARLGNDAHTYLGLLENFYLHFPDFEREIAETQDTEILTRRLHTMKGMSMSVGATRLETLVKEAEHFLMKNKLNSTAEIQQEFADVYQSIGKALKACSSFLSTENQKQNLSVAMLIEGVRNRQYLRRVDAEAYRDLLESNYGKDNSDEIIDAIVNLDYKKALALLLTEEDR